MSEKMQETIADIVAEMRRYSDFVIVKNNYCNRIEAAHTENGAAVSREAATAENSSAVGNAAKLREALYDIIMLTMKVGYSIHGDVACGIIASKARLALAAPPRNCDVGTAEEQAERYLNHCESFIRKDGSKPCTGCPCCGVVKAGKCEFAWAQLPYKSEATA